MGNMGNEAACLRDPWWILGKTEVLCHVKMCSLQFPFYDYRLLYNDLSLKKTQL